VRINDDDDDIAIPIDNQQQNTKILGGCLNYLSAFQLLLLLDNYQMKACCCKLSLLLM